MEVGDGWQLIITIFVILNVFSKNHSSSDLDCSGGSRYLPSLSYANIPIYLLFTASCSNFSLLSIASLTRFISRSIWSSSDKMRSLWCIVLRSVYAQISFPKNWPLCATALPNRCISSLMAFSSVNRWWKTVHTVELICTWQFVSYHCRTLLSNCHFSCQYSPANLHFVMARDANFLLV